MANIGFNVNQAVQHVGDHWERDGLPTLMLGLLNLVGGSLTIWMPHYHSFWRDSLVSGLLLLFFGAFFYFVARKNSHAMGWLKARITYPRTGYVALPPLGSAAEVRLKGVELKRYPETWMVFPVLLSTVVYTPWFGTALAILAISVIWAISRGKFPFSGIRIPGLYLSALLLPFLPVAPGNRVSYFLIALGLLYLLVGTVQLFTYLRRHPVVQT